MTTNTLHTDSDIGDLPLYTLGVPGRLWSHKLKRPIDFVCALLVFCVLLLPLLGIATLLILFQGGNPMFLQQRVGRRCVPFNIIKFRTMNDKRDQDGALLPDEERTTWLGGILRSTSLDELPEILNVLKGDMSFIGPRPWIPEQMELFDERTRMRRMSIRPGISGLAQILGRNNLTFRQRVSFDLRYARHLSCRLDLAILFFTFYKVVKREGIYQRPDAMARLQGSAAPKDPDTRGLRGNYTRYHATKFMD